MDSLGGGKKSSRSTGLFPVVGQVGFLTPPRDRACHSTRAIERTSGGTRALGGDWGTVQTTGSVVGRWGCSVLEDVSPSYL